MDGLGYAGALGLATTFVLAGGAKLARPAATAASFAALGVPAAAVTARVVPVVELLVAAALLAAPRMGGVAALVLLTPFTAVLTRAVAAGSKAPCNCFGAVGSDPVSRADTVRNVLLLVPAGLSLAAAAPTVPSPLAALVAVAMFAAGWILLARLRRPRA